MNEVIVLPHLVHGKDNDLLSALSVFSKNIPNENTRAATEKALRDFYSFKKVYSITVDINLNRCVDFKDWMLKDKGYKAATVTQRLNLVSTFFDFLLIEGFISENPMKRLKRPEITDQKNTEALSAEEVTLLLNGCPKEDPTDLCFFVALQLQLRIGCRVGELARLKWENLKTNQDHTYTLSFIQKGGKIRAVGIPKFLGDMLEEYALIWQDKTGLELLQHDYIFQFTYNKYRCKQKVPFAHQAHNKRLKALAKRVGIKRDLHSHQFRATFITQCLNANINSRDVSITAGCTVGNIERYDNGSEEINRKTIDSLPY